MSKSSPKGDHSPQTRFTPGEPTRFAELNTLLHGVAARTGDILGSNFVGAYLQGSFAVGDADIHSDCDFLIPVNGPITSKQEGELRTLHAEIPTRPGHWTKHLEGSYPNRSELKSLDGLGAPWLYIDHGWRKMQWSTHCNTEVARWSLRERGITLAGPDPRELVDEVPAEALKQRMRQDIPTFLDAMLEWISLDIAWAQRYAVTTLCRMLYTLHSGQVASKKAALEWSRNRLDTRWRPLLQQVLEDRELGFDPDARPQSGSVEATLAFADCARATARQ